MSNLWTRGQTWTPWPSDCLSWSSPWFPIYLPTEEKHQRQRRRLRLRVRPSHRPLFGALLVRLGGVVEELLAAVGAEAVVGAVSWVLADVAFVGAVVLCAAGVIGAAPIGLVTGVGVFLAAAVVVVAAIVVTAAVVAAAAVVVAAAAAVAAAAVVAAGDTKVKAQPQQQKPQDSGPNLALRVKGQRVNGGSVVLKWTSCLLQQEAASCPTRRR